MKRAIFVALVCLSVMALYSVTDAAPKTNVGCGLGTSLFEGKDGLLSQTFAATTNGSYSQTFGITSGTSGCTQFKGIVSNERVQIFVADNMDSLANDISEGNGEYLNTLAVLLEISEANRVQFYSMMQSNFSNIFTSKDITSTEVVSNIDNLLKNS